MKPKWIILIFVLPLFFSCGPSAREAAAYNDSIIAIQRRIYGAILNLQKSFDVFVEKQDSKILDSAFEQARRAINNGSRKLDEIGPLGDDSLLFNAAKELFAAYKQVLDSNYAENVRIYKLPPEQTSQQTWQEFERQYNLAAKKIKQANEIFVKRQEDFARKYQLDLE